MLFLPDPRLVRLVEVAGRGAEAAAQQLLRPSGDGGGHAHGVLRLQNLDGTWAAAAPQGGGGGGNHAVAAPIVLEEAAAADSPGSWRFGGGGYGVADAADVSNDDSDGTATTEEFEDAGEGSDDSLDSFKVTLADLGVEESPEPRHASPALSFTVTDG